MRILGLFLLLIPALLHSQDRLLMMNGETIEGRIVDDLGMEIRIELETKKGKTKEYYFHRSEVFSVTKEGKEEVLLYQYNDEEGNFLTEDQMRIFIAGEQDARSNYNVKPTAIIGLVLGTGGAILAGGGLITTVSIPILYTAYQFIPVIHIKEQTITNPAHQYNDAYAMGYERVARSRRVLTALKTSAAGMAVGVVVVLLTVE